MKSFHPRLMYCLGKIIKHMAVTISTELLDLQDFWEALAYPLQVKHSAIPLS